MEVAQYLPAVTEEPSSTACTMANEISSSPWFASVQATTPFSDFTFDNPYMTPHTSSLGTFSPTSTEIPKSSDSMSSYTRASQDLTLELPRSSDSYPYGFVPMGDNILPARPRSSPSTFSPTSGPRFEELLWNHPAGLGISHPGPHEIPYSRSTYPPLCFPRSPGGLRTPVGGGRLSEAGLGLQHVPQVMAPQPRRMYAPIAPNPQGLSQISQTKKRPRDDDELSEDSKRRKRADSMNVPAELTEEDKLLLKLKDEENLAWKDIAARFQSDLGKKYQIPALQMRLKRLRERLRVWTEADISALKKAHEYWVQNKYEIIASKMLEFGASDRWSSKQCNRKWQELDPGPPAYSTYEASTPSMSYSTSPIDAPSYLPFLHIPQ